MLCGHTHLACNSTIDGIAYYNSGSWCESPCTYLTIADGQVEVCHYSDPSPADTVVTEGSYIESPALTGSREEFAPHP